MTAVHPLTTTTFDTEVLGSEGPVVVDFWAEWCGPCHALDPILEEIAIERAGKLKVFSVDSDAYPDLSLRFDVMSLPTLLVFVDGQVVRQLIGARGKRHLLAELAEVIDTEATTAA